MSSTGVIDVDVVVVGAGPAGSACAAVLARHGVRTMVLEARRFPRDKVCGDGLGSRVPAALARIGIDPQVLDQRFHRLGRVRVTSPGGIGFSAAIPAVPERGTAVHVAPRKELDLLLRQHAEDCGAEIREGVRAVDLVRNDGRVEGVVCRREDGGVETIRTRVVVGAGGEQSLVRRVLGTPPVSRRRSAFAIRAYFEGITGLEDAIELHYDRSFSPAYAWIFPLGEGRANVGCGVFDFWGANRGLDLQAALAGFLAEHPVARQRFANARRETRFRGWSLALGSQTGRSVSDGALLIGDAACFINPLTGEGISYALTSGALAAEVIVAALAEDDCSEQRLSEYERAWRRMFSSDFRSGHLMRVMVGRYPWLLDRIARRARKDTVYAAAMAGAIVGSFTPGRLLSPRMLLRLLLG